MSDTLILVGRFSCDRHLTTLAPPRRYVLGRSSSSDIVVDHPSVSRRHAEVCPSAQGITVTDLCSRNGTFIEDERVAAGSARPGQRLRFGHVAFLLASVADGCDADSECSTDHSGQPPRSAGARGGGPPLTPAQRRVFDLLVLGLSEKELAARLRLSVNTVHHHIGAIYRALGVTSRAEFLVQIHTQPTGGSVGRTRGIG